MFHDNPGGGVSASPVIKPLSPADRMWLFLGFQILLWELFCPPGQLLSEAADRWIDRHPVLTRFGIIVVAAHLGNYMEGVPLKWLDPFKLSARLTAVHTRREP